MCSFSSVSIVMAHWTSLDCASTASLIHLKTVSKVMGASLASWKKVMDVFPKFRLEIGFSKNESISNVINLSTWNKWLELQPAGIAWYPVFRQTQTMSQDVPGCPRMSQDVPGCPRIKIDLNLTQFKKQARQALSWHASAFAIAPASRGALLRPARGPLVQQET